MADDFISDTRYFPSNIFTRLLPIVDPGAVGELPLFIFLSFPGSIGESRQLIDCIDARSRGNDLDSALHEL